MPNHVTNKIVARGPLSRVEALLAQGRVPGKDGEEREFSLRGFIPPPDDPDYDTDGCSHQHPMRGLPDALLKELGIDPKKADPHPNCWYVWNTTNWGTKWDCYEAHTEQDKETVLESMARLDAGEQYGGTVIYFDTAWSPPMPVIQKIVELYPDLDIDFTFMDEDMFGGGGGRSSYRKGKLVEERDGINDKNDPEFVQIATDLKSYNPADFEDEEDEG